MKTTILLPVISLFLFLASCTNPSDKKVNDQTSESSESGVTSTDWQSRYDKLESSDLSDNVIQLIGKEWMLVTAGDESSFNTMTASWGGMGYIWERPSTFIFIRDTRYTYQFLQQHESFTMSGRNTDKVKEAGLTPLETPSGLMSFEEARMIIECKKMFIQELDYGNLTEPYKSKIMEEAYKNELSKHQMFISEIVNIWIKK